MLKMTLKLEWKDEGRTAAWSWHEVYLPIELLNNSIKDYQTKPDSISIVSLIILNIPELLKEIVSVVFFDTKPSVLYLNLQILLLCPRIEIDVIFNWYYVLDVTLHGILDGVGL